MGSVRFRQIPKLIERLWSEGGAAADAEWGRRWAALGQSGPVLERGGRRASSAAAAPAQAQEVIDAHALVGSGAPEYRPRPSPGQYSLGFQPVAGRVAPPRPRTQGPRRLSQQVMKLQQDMFMLMRNQQFKEAVSLFEDFINEGFKEAAVMKLPRGQLPNHKKPGDFQFLQYIQSLQL
eukprot:evm.model.scf_989.6 EVM.evm.TU.scf_989.6   scf_989:41700-43502(+)